MMSRRPLMMIFVLEDFKLKPVGGVQRPRISGKEKENGRCSKSL